MNNYNCLNEIEQLDSILEKNKCFIYGAGKVSRMIIKYASYKSYKLYGIFVSDMQKNPSNIMGISVKTIQDYLDNNKELCIIVCVMENLHQEIFDSLSQFQFLKLYFIQDFLSNAICYKLADYELELYQEIKSVEHTQMVLLQELKNIKDGWIRSMPQPGLQYFILNILDHCNLNCKGCNHFSSLAEEKFVNFETLKKDLQQMYVVHGDIPRFSIMGGEPLLHPQIIEILICAREIFPKAEILLSTNGVLCKNKEKEFWEICKKYHITIRFTKYPIHLDYDLLTKEIERQGVTVSYFNEEVSTRFQNIAMDVTGHMEPKDSFFECGFANHCVFLMEGKLYTCQVIANSKYLSKEFGFSMPIGENDFIDIYRHSREEVLNFLARPVSFCRFCNVKKRKSASFEWGVTKKESIEWT